MSPNQVEVVFLAGVGDYAVLMLDLHTRRRYHMDSHDFESSSAKEMKISCHFVNLASQLASQ